MHIVVVIPYFEPAWAYGGPPRLMSRVVRELAKRHTITVLTTDVLDKNHRARPLHEQNGPVRIIRCKTLSNALAWHAKIIIPIGFRRVAAETLPTADVVLFSDFRHWLNAASLSIVLRHRIAYGLAAFGQIRKPTDSKWLLKVLYDLFWGRRMIRLATFLIAQTEHEAGDYALVGGRREQVAVLPLAEDQPTQQEFAKRGTFRAAYGIGSNEKVILFVGRIHVHKGITVLVKAFALLKHQWPAQKFRLVVVGRNDGYQRQIDVCIRSEGVEGSVIQTGALYGPENAAAYTDADLFALTPTHYEETSLAAVRALSFGLPVLTVRQAELPFLDAYKAGKTVECTPAAVAAGLTELFSDDTLLLKKRMQARVLFEEHYTFDHTVTLLEDAIRKTIRNV